jgi:hypothetical protein
MTKSDELKQIAQNCADLAQTTLDNPKKKRLERLADGYSSLAQNQAWLDGERKTSASKDG